MIISKISPARMLEIKFTKAIKKGHVSNVELCPQPPQTDIELENDEKWVAKIVSKIGQPYFFTSSRMIWKPEQNWHYLVYEDLRRVHWINDLDDMGEKLKLKQSLYDRVILEKHNGERIVLDQLGPSAFVLMNVFHWLLVQERRDLDL